ncbi:LysR substrate-binding domain-containing protein [Mesorhizobium sp. M0684]|uniref:LysR substrate-binding domain-containing protein n=1 Tax=unclassified Mesorhizobium TaxID=325217 RepID=UPI0033397625
MFETELLRSFVTITEAGGFTRAAAVLNSTQSTVSAQIRRLEEQAGQTLFARSTRSVQLTLAGETLLGYARTILRLNEDARLRLSGSRQDQRIRLGASEDLASSWLPRILRRFAGLYPGVQVDLEIGIGPRLVQMLDGEGLDVVVSGACDGSFDGSVLWSEPLVWAFAKEGVLSTPPQLAFFPESCPYRDVAIRTLAKTRTEWRISCTSSSLAGVRAAALGSFAASPLPQSLVGQGLRALSENEGLPALPDVTYVLRVAPGEPSTAVSALITVIQSASGMNTAA